MGSPGILSKLIDFFLKLFSSNSSNAKKSNILNPQKKRGLKDLFQIKSNSGNTTNNNNNYQKQSSVTFSSTSNEAILISPTDAVPSTPSQNQIKSDNIDSILNKYKTPSSTLITADTSQNTNSCDAQLIGKFKNKKNLKLFFK